MKHAPTRTAEESAAFARQQAAIRLMQRVDALTSRARVEVVPAPSESPAAEGRAYRQLLDELEALDLAQHHVLKRSPNGNFYPVGNKDGSTHRTVVERLILKGLMRYDNSCKSYVELTDAGRDAHA